jgi:hypothetical protein
MGPEQSLMNQELHDQDPALQLKLNLTSAKRVAAWTQLSTS